MSADDRFVDMIRPGSGCNLAETFAIFKEIFDRTNGNPCDGCGFKNNCDFLKKRKSDDKQQRIRNFGKVNFETNAQIAKRLTKEGGRGKITPRQVSKMRKRGEL